MPAKQINGNHAEDGDSLENGIVHFATGGKLQKRVRRLIRSKPVTGLPLVFKRGSVIIKKYPDGREEQIAEVPAPAYKLPPGVKIFGHKG